MSSIFSTFACILPFNLTCKEFQFFQDLQPQVKLKLLLSFLHIGRRNLEQWRTELEDILDVALQDSEPWVSMLADLLSSFPSSGQLNAEVRGDGRKIYMDLMADLKKTLKKHGDQSDLVLPLECHFLNKNAFISVVGHQPQPTKHFSLKMKPKAAALKADLIQRSQEAANKVKSQLSTFPTRIRFVISSIIFPSKIQHFLTGQCRRKCLILLL